MQLEEALRRIKEYEGLKRINRLLKWLVLWYNELATDEPSSLKGVRT
jgi:hypothetical protein